MRKRLIFAACLCVCAAGMAFMSGCEIPEVPTEQVETTHFAEPDLVRHKPGETFESNDFIITYISAGKVDSVNDGKNKPPKGKEFYQIKVKYESKVENEKHINYNCFIGFADDVVVDQFYFTDDVIRGNLTGVGDSATGTLTYTVPEGADKIEVIYQYDMYTEEKIAFTVK